jgi:hypothetical protein
LTNNTYQILKKNIPKVKLVSATSQNWYDSFGVLTPWSGSIYNGPSVCDIYYTVSSGSLPVGYYKWSGNRWFKVQDDIFDSYNLPVFLESKVDEMGVFVGFDGAIEQVEQMVNFTYKQNNKTVTIYNSVDTNKYKKLVNQVYNVNWGDGTTGSLSTNQYIVGQQLPNISHEYQLFSSYTITISLTTPWESKKISKQINVPVYDIIENPFGFFTNVVVPAYENATGQTQEYLTDLDYTNNVGFTPTGFTYMSIGKSRISEKKLYGQNKYSGVTAGVDDIGNYSAYTIDNLYYKDYNDGYTMITGTTSAYTREDAINKVITRNEHFLGFVEQPKIYTDVFIERGKQNVMENNYRLNEVDNVGELEIYQNEYFIVKKQ